MAVCTGGHRVEPAARCETLFRRTSSPGSATNRLGLLIQELVVAIN